MATLLRPKMCEMSLRGGGGVGGVVVESGEGGVLVQEVVVQGMVYSHLGGLGGLEGVEGEDGILFKVILRGW